MTSLPIMPIVDFINLGYLQEANRQWFHPLGLALFATFQDNKPIGIGLGVQATDDQEGIKFADTDIDAEKAHRILKEQTRREVARRKALGYVIQPIIDIGGQC